MTHNLIYVKALELVKLANTAVPTFQYAINKFHEMQGELLKMIAIGGYENPTTKNKSSSGSVADGGRSDKPDGTVHLMLVITRDSMMKQQTTVSMWKTCTKTC